MGKWKKIMAAGAALTGAYAVLRQIAKRQAVPADIDADNPYIGSAEDKQGTPADPDGSRSSDTGSADSEGKSVYEDRVKPALDRALSFGCLAGLSPLYAAISLAIWLDDPGPVFFTQKRVGKDKHFIPVHKFRSMALDAPHDVPTHQLADPEQYITKVGRFLRKTSLDELPQLWDIFCGNMSVVGPRPALWNQDDLVAERNRYGANDVTPGLTGLAQIRGRDELEIPVKAQYDGEYTAVLKKGGLEAFRQDARCILGTVGSVLKHDGVVEGGTGRMALEGDPDRKEDFARDGLKEANAVDAGFDDYGCDKKFTINPSARRKILVTGKGSYIGESFHAYADKHYPRLEIDTIDLLDAGWRDQDFGVYDTVYHLAGIAHADTGRISEEQAKQYYAVNTDLAVEVCKKAKADGVRQFIFMSSMIVYGDSAPYGTRRVIDRYTLPHPANVYGDSKWQADVAVRKLQDIDFSVAVIRAPMIYGRGSKGNYPILAKLAKRLPVFPGVRNERSMLYIENLCEFVCRLAISGEGGIYFPQNAGYTRTSTMVKEIAAAAGKGIYISHLLDPAVALASRMPGRIGTLTDKAFGNSVYDQRLSRYEGLEYRKVSLRESVRRTEDDHYDSEAAEADRPHILVISQYFYPETFRINDMAAEWVRRGYKVTVLTGIPNYPMGKFFDGYGYRSRRRENYNGADIIRIPLIPRGTGSLGMAANYFSFAGSGFFWQLTSGIRADLVFTFEVSPMTQALIGCWYSRRYHVPHFLYVQDLWPENVSTVAGIHSPAVIRPINRMVDYIYRNADEIFTTSPAFVKAIAGRDVKVPGPKVHYWPQYAEDFYRPLDGKQVRQEKAGQASPVHDIADDGSFCIAFTGNIGTAQGLDILPKTAERLKEMHTGRRIRFVIVGDGRYQEAFEQEIRQRNVGDMFTMIPRQPAEEIPYILACCDAAFLSFRNTRLWEMTIPAKLQSYMSCGIPVIAAAKGETQRVITEAQCGVCSPIGDSGALAKAILKMTESDLEKMGKNGRAYCEAHFDKKALMDEMDGWIGRTLDREDG